MYDDLIVIALVAAAVGFTGPAFQPVFEPSPVPSEWRRGFESIHAEDASKLVHHLAGPTYKGRSPQTDDYMAAAQWCADWMKRNGIQPGAPDGTYFQKFDLVRVQPEAEKVWLTYGTEKLTLGKDFTFMLTGDSPSIKSYFPITFIRVPKGHRYPPIQRGSLANKLVILHPENAANDPSGHTAIMRMQAADSSTQIAVPVADTRSMTPRTATFLGGAKGEGSFRAFQINQTAADRLAKAAGATSYLSGDKPSVESLAKADLAGTTKREVFVETANVVGLIPGSDRAMKKEAVVIGAHLDHIGVTERGTHFGADDNASGVGAALMIGRALVKNPVKPKRSVVIGLWSSEELGLWGSKQYAANPTFGMADTIAYLNMDMVGRDAEYKPFSDRPEDNRNAIYAGSAEFSSPELYQLLAAANRHIGLNLRDDKNDRTRRSDTASFYEKNVPVLKAFTGEHPDYHRPGDTPEKLNYPKMAKVAQWLYLSTQELASRPGRPSFDANASMLTGTATIEGLTELADDCVIEATLVEANPDASRVSVLDTTTQAYSGQLPFSFALKYHPTRIDPFKIYAVRVRVFVGGKLFARNKAGKRVLTFKQPTTARDVVLERASQ